MDKIIHIEGKCTLLGDDLTPRRGVCITVDIDAMLEKIQEIGEEKAKCAIGDIIFNYIVDEKK